MAMYSYADFDALLITSSSDLVENQLTSTCSKSLIASLIPSNHFFSQFSRIFSASATLTKCFVVSGVVYVGVSGGGDGGGDGGDVHV